jgi:hypothetical protein
VRNKDRLSDLRYCQRLAVLRALTGLSNPGTAEPYYALVARGGVITKEEINEILRGAGLPESETDGEVDAILKGSLSNVPCDVRKFHACVVAKLLQEGKCGTLAELMEKQSLDWNGLETLINQRCQRAKGIFVSLVPRSHALSGSLAIRHN